MMMGQISLIKSARAYVEYNVEHIKQEVQALFATPIYFSQLERNFSNEELQFIENSKIVVKFQCEEVKVPKEKLIIPPKKPKITT